MATEHEDNDKNAAAPSLSKHGAARRRLTKVGVGVAGGVLATLESKSAMATSTYMCKTPSGFASGNLSNSHYGTDTATCLGKTPKWWKSCNQTSWRSKMFKDIFECSSSSGSCPTRYSSYPVTVNHVTTPYYKANYLSCLTLDDLLNSQPCDSDGLAQQFVAAYLNIQSGWISVLSLYDLKNMWHEYVTTTKFSPTANVYWYATDIVKYLSSLNYSNT